MKLEEVIQSAMGKAVINTLQGENPHRQNEQLGVRVLSHL